MRTYLILAAAALTAACSANSPDPSAMRANQKVSVRHFTFCTPKTEVAAKLVDGRAPIYPVHRMLAREEGHAILEFDISADGRTENFKRIESSHPKFYVHTRAAMKQWTFEPARENGVAVAVHCRFRQTFSMPESMRGRP